MHVGQGRTIAATAVTLLGLAAAAVAPPAAIAAPRPRAARPALAVGRSADGTTWRLEGRRLTVSLGGDVITDRPTRIVARCGERLFPFAVRDAFVTSADLSVTVRWHTRRFSVELPRDVARTVSWCGLLPADGRGETMREAAMRIVRGAAQGCRPSARETVVLRDAKAVVTRAVAGGDGSFDEVYRACQRPNGQLRPLFAAGDWGGGGGYGVSVHDLTRRGRWLTWSVTVTPHGSGPPSDSVWRADLADPERAARIADAALSPDGRTVTWRENGMERRVEVT